MKYNILTIADVHWGALDSEELFNHLQLVIDTIESREIDIVIINGDYFDYRLHLNSLHAILSIQWFDLLYSTCKKNNVKKIRIVKGTSDHDNKQLEIFRGENYPSPYLEIINFSMVEKIFDDLTVLYCPDETINAVEYYPKYKELMDNEIDIGFFHGSFDIVLPEIRQEEIVKNELPTIVFDYDYFSKNISGPLISGHWHVYTEHEKLTYVGSFDRWKFDEDEKKGFLITEYDTETKSYKNEFIINEKAKEYKTLKVMNTEYKTPNDFMILYNILSDMREQHPNGMLRLVYIVMEENDESIYNFNNFRSSHSSTKNLKIDIKDMVKKKKKREASENFIKNIDEYSYIFEKSKSISYIIKTYLEKTEQIFIPEEEIEKRIAKYLNK